MTIQVHIRHMGGKDVSLDDCSSFSGFIGQALESSQLLEQNYVLEVSSPGIGNQLINDRDFETFKGFPVEITVKNESNNEFHHEGLLHKRSIDHVHLNRKGRITLIPRKEVLEVRLTTPAS